MVHLHEMCDLMRDDVVQDPFRGENQAPGEGQSASVRAAPPTPLRVAHGDPRYALTDSTSEQIGALGAFAPSFSLEKIRNSAREVLNLSGDQNLAPAESHAM